MPKLRTTVVAALKMNEIVNRAINSELTNVRIERRTDIRAGLVDRLFISIGGTDSHRSQEVTIDVSFSETGTEQKHAVSHEDWTRVTKGRYYLAQMDIVINSLSSRRDETQAQIFSENMALAARIARLLRQEFNDRVTIRVMTDSDGQVIVNPRDEDLIDV